MTAVLAKELEEVPIHLLQLQCDLMHCLILNHVIYTCKKERRSSVEHYLRLKRAATILTLDQSKRYADGKLCGA